MPGLADILEEMIRSISKSHLKGALWEKQVQS